MLAVVVACGGNAGIDRGAIPAPDAGATSEGASPNACGGTVPLVFDGRGAAPGDPCGPCRDGALVCASPSLLACVGALPSSVCADATVGLSDDASAGSPTPDAAAFSTDGGLADSEQVDVSAETSPSSDAALAPFEGGAGWQPTDAGAAIENWTDAGVPSVTCLDLPTNDLVLDPVRDVLYASVPSTASVYGNSVVRIDPSSARLTGTVFSGSQPGALAVSDDGTLLYVGVDGAASVLPIDLATGHTGPSVYLGTSSFGARTARAIRVAPGAATRYVVSRQNAGYSPSFAGLAMYDGTTRVGEWNSFVGGESLAFASPTILYGYNNETSGYDLYKFTVSATSLAAGPDTMGLIAGATNITSQGGWLFANDGQTVDSATTQLVGHYAAFGPVWPSADGVNVWFLAYPTYTGTPAVPTLEDFDRSSFLMSRLIPLPAATLAQGDVPTSLVAWSRSGFAFRSPVAVCVVVIGP